MYALVCPVFHWGLRPCAVQVAQLIAAISSRLPEIELQLQSSNPLAYASKRQAVQHANSSNLAVTTEAQSWCVRLTDFVAIHLVKDAKKMVADVGQDSVTQCCRGGSRLQQQITLGPGQIRSTAKCVATTTRAHELRGVRNMLLCRMGPEWIVLSWATWPRAIQRSRLLQSSKLLSIVNALAPGERRSRDRVGFAALVELAALFPRDRPRGYRIPCLMSPSN